MPVALLILGFLSVGSLAFFGRLAALDAKRSLIAVNKYGGVDLFMIGVLAYIYLPSAIQGLLSTSPQAAVTQKMLLLNIVLTCALLTLVLGIIVGRLINPLDLFGLRRKSPRTIFLTAGAALLALIPLVFFALLFTQYVVGQTPEQPLMQFLRSHKDWADRSLLIFTAVILAPVSEEIIFRGYVYGVARRYAGRWFALIFSALFFGTIHGHAPSLIPLTLLAVCLTLAYEFTGSLWTTMLMHGAFNSITIIAAIWWPELG